MRGKKQSPLVNFLGCIGTDPKQRLKEAWARAMKGKESIVEVPAPHVQEFLKEQSCTNK